jgi:DNA-directed RNA polymerase specialized sigma24 family protein
MWTSRFALALALLMEFSDATEAHLLLKAKVAAVCRRRRIVDDTEEVLQNVWIAVLQLLSKHIIATNIADQTSMIVENQAINVVRERVRIRKLDALWEASSLVDESQSTTDDSSIDIELSNLLTQLRIDNPRQFDAVELTLQSLDQEEARHKWQLRNAAQITPVNFRQMYHRGTRRLRAYWENSND